MSLFGLWKPECPVSYREKAWVETRMRWLGAQFGARRLTRCQIVLPTEEFFPGRFDGTPEAAGRVFERVCQYMEIPPAEVRLQFAPEEAMRGVAGLYQPGLVLVKETQLAEPIALVATMAHELAHHLLIGRRLLEREPDCEFVTDLTPVIFGLGVFTANATVLEEHSRMGNVSWRSIGKQGYLPSRVTAYAMALHGWLCGDEKPAWLSHLRTDAADALTQGLRYLTATEHSLLRPDNLYSGDHAPSASSLIGQLGARHPADRVAALWEFARHDSATAEVVQAVTERLEDRYPGVRAEAARALAQWGPAADSAIPQLADVLEDADEEVRMAAAYAIGRLHGQAERVVPLLVRQLDDPLTVNTAAWALGQFGPAAASALPRLLVRLGDELGRGDGAIDYLSYAIRMISPDPETEIQRLVASCDEETQTQASELLPESGPIALPGGSTGVRFWAGG
ncbi:MAG: HEAT repeat domain-containing protein [Thermoguttaceae bacterium]